MPRAVPIRRSADALLPRRARSITFLSRTGLRARSLRGGSMSSGTASGSAERLSAAISGGGGTALGFGTGGSDGAALRQGGQQKSVDRRRVRLITVARKPVGQLVGGRMMIAAQIPNRQ